jgi:hypothetical protein
MSTEASQAGRDAYWKSDYDLTRYPPGGERDRYIDAAYEAAMADDENDWDEDEA